MNISEFLLSYGNLISITLIPVIIWVLGIRYQDRKTKKDAKLSLFLTLMANRKTSPINKEWVDSLNIIDVVFQDDKKVRQAWLEYFESLHENSVNNQNSAIYLLVLLSEMANSLDYGDLKQTEIDRFYSPQYFGSQMTRQELMTQEELRIMMSSKSYSEAFSEEERIQHYNNLMKKQS